MICKSLVLMGLLLAARVVRPQAPATEPLSGSLVSLIATPERYDGKLVLVRGFMVIEYEGLGVYLHREDWNRVIPKNGIWLNLTLDQQKRWKKISNSYAVIEGRFSATETGHLGGFSGALNEITRVLQMRTSGGALDRSPPRPDASTKGEK